MKRRLLSLVLALVLVLGAAPVALAGPGDRDLLHETLVADALYDLGLFQGRGTNDDGTPRFDLDETATRAEAITMLVRLKGEDVAAKAANYDHPFDDVKSLDAWANAYVGWAYARGYTTGTSNGPEIYRFGTKDRISCRDFTTMCLRAMGYSDKAGDFSWQNPETLASDVWLYAACGHRLQWEDFRRGDLVMLAFGALAGDSKAGDRLGDRMAEAGVFTKEAWDAATDAVDTSPYRYRMHDGILYGTFYCSEDADGFRYEYKYRPQLILKEDNTFELYRNFGEGMDRCSGTWVTGYDPMMERKTLQLNIVDDSVWGDVYNRDRILFYYEGNGSEIRLYQYLGVTPQNSVFGWGHY